MASRNLGSNRLPISAQPGGEVIGHAPRIPAVAPSNGESPQSRPGTIVPMAYDGDEGGLGRFSEDLNGLDGRFGDIPAVSPSTPPGHAFSESDYSASSSDNDGHIAAVRSGSGMLC